MSTYRKLHGRSIQAVTTDPTESVAEGQVWYNTTSDTFKTVLTQESWVASSKMNTPRATMAGGGIRTSAIISGKNGANPSDAALAESYNGTGWTSLTNVPAPRGYAVGTGSDSEEYVQAGGGYPSYTTDVYDWDGSSWTSGTGIPTATIEAGMCGPAAAAFFFGGNAGLTTSYARSGGSWTSGGTMASGVYAATAVGTQTAAISMGGVKYPGGYQNDNQSYDGTSWTALTDLPANRGYAGGAGVQTLAMVIAGEGPPTYSSNLEWNGSSWTTLASLATARNTLAKGATTTNTAIAPPGNQTPATTEEYNRSASVITAAAWASGGALTAGARRGLASGKNSQTLTAGLVFGGGASSYSTVGVKTEEYDGTSFTAGGDLNTYRYSLGGAGTQTAGLGFGGYIYPPAVSSNATEEYDGSSWTSVNNMSDARQSMASFGTQTAAIAAAGYSKPTTTNLNTTLSYDGTNWTALSSPANVNTTRSGLAGSGTQTAGLATGGNSSPYKQTEEWDGSAWTNQNSTIVEHKNVINQQLGIQTNALICGGGPSPTTSTEGYDGTSWSTRPNMASGRYESAAGGSATSGFVTGGFTTANVSTTEEFTGETSAVNVKTLTQS